MKHKNALIHVYNPPPHTENLKPTEDVNKNIIRDK